MKLVTIANTATGSPGAMLRSGEILHFNKVAKLGTMEAWIPDSIRAILEGGQDALALVKQLVDRIEALHRGYRLLCWLWSLVSFVSPDIGKVVSRVLEMVRCVFP